MLSSEILKRVRQIEIISKKLVDDVLTGSYKSQFKGQGMQFAEHRVYEPGDDVRHIDWKVSARTRDPLVKKYEEERELTVLLVIDVSASQEFGSKQELKSEVAAQVAGMLAYAANVTGDRVGAILFSDRVEKIIPPKKGRGHLLRLVRDVLAYQPEGKGTQLSVGLDAARRVLKHSGIVFVISDFQDQDFTSALKQLSRKNDVIAVRLEDPREWSVPKLGYMLLKNPETNVETFVNTASFLFQKWIKDEKSATETRLSETFKQARVDCARLSTDLDYSEFLVRFLKARAKR